MTSSAGSMALKYREPSYTTPDSEKPVRAKFRLKLDLGNNEDFGSINPTSNSSPLMRRLFEQTLNVQQALASRSRETITFTASKKS